MRKLALVVDDDMDVLDILSEIVEEVGFQVCQTHGGGQALEVIASGVRPDILITDLHMPEVSGDQVIVAARRAFTYLPAILVTGTSTSLPQSLVGANSLVVLPKPCSMEELQAAVRSLTK